MEAPSATRFEQEHRYGRTAATVLVVPLALELVALVALVVWLLVVAVSG